MADSTGLPRFTTVTVPGIDKLDEGDRHTRIINDNFDTLKDILEASISDGSIIDPSIISHSVLLDLDADDHLHYLTEARHLAIKGNPHDTTWLQLTDTSPGTYAGTGILWYSRVNATFDGMELHRLIHDDIDIFTDAALETGYSARRIAQMAGKREAKPTGIISGAELNIVNGGLDVQVLTGTGAIIDYYTNPGDETVLTYLTWPDLQQAIATPTANLISWVMLQESIVPGEAEIVQLLTRPSPVDQRNLIYVGLITWDGAAWNDVSLPIVENSSPQNFAEVFKDVFPPLSFELGGHIGEEAGFTMSIDESLIWQLNRNHHINPRDPNREAFGPINPISFRYITGDFAVVSAPTTVIDPSQWENPLGTVDPTVGGGANTSTIQRLWFDQADQFFVTWGQNTYPTFDEARASIASDTSKSTFANYLTRDCILLGYIVSAKSDTDWGLTSAEFIPFVGTAIGGGGGAPISLFTGLTDTPSTYAVQGTKTLLVDALETMVEFDYRPWWKGLWVSGTYLPQQIVRDDEWLMIANKATTDRPAPQPTGSPFWTVPDAPAWVVSQFTGVVESSLHVQNITDLWGLSKVRVWVQGITANDNYRLVTRDNVSGSISIGQEFSGNILPIPGWLERTDDYALSPGADITLTLIHENSAGTTDFNHPWVVIGANNQDIDPGAGNTNWDNQITRLRLSETDDDAVDRSAELASVVLNTIIRVVDEDDLNAYYEFEVIGVADQGLWWQYNVVLLDTGTSGPPPLGRSQVHFEVPVATPTDYVTLAGAYPGAASLSGILTLGGGVPLEDDSSYGVDIFVQQYTVSPDWDIMSLSGSTGGGAGGGGTTEFFTDLLDTPGGYAASGGFLTMVRNDETGLEFLSLTDVITPLYVLKAGDIMTGPLEVPGVNNTGVIDHDGTLAGFFGVEPVVQPIVISGNGATLDDVIQGLVDLGLFGDAVVAGRDYYHGDYQEVDFQ